MLFAPRLPAGSAPSFHPAEFARAGFSCATSPEAQALSDDEIIREAREAFERAADAEAENRREALDDLRFARLGEQWPAAIKRERDLVPYLLRSKDAPPGADTAR
jgi:hypothetical protein